MSYCIILNSKQSAWKLQKHMSTLFPPTLLQQREGQHEELGHKHKNFKRAAKKGKNEGLEYKKAKNIGTSKTNMLERRAKLIKHVSPMTRKDTSFMIAVSQESTI